MFVGIDVSKHRLDIHSRPSGESSTFGHDDEGVAALVGRLAALAPALVVLEATGAPGGLQHLERPRRVGMVGGDRIDDGAGDGGERSQVDHGIGTLAHVV